MSVAESYLGFLNLFDLIAVALICMTAVFVIGDIVDGKKPPSPQPSPLKGEGEGGEKDE